ncbi:MAG TPA: glycosyltransferase family 39 protein [Actinomycetota bacterium]|nr:glycosyltransferase family 39 protein [Actinomycetota bacterium]
MSGVNESTRAVERGEPPEPATGERRDELLLRGLIVFAIGVLWLRPIASSFWLDELGTYWVVRGGFGQMLDLAWRYQGQSPAYYVVAWLARVVGGGNEIVMRLPSFVAAALATIILSRLARRLFGPGATWLAAAVFAVIPVVAFRAIDARPYAFAYLALITATLCLVRLVEEGTPRMAVAYGAAVAATVYFHYLFAFALLGHVPYLMRRWASCDRPIRRRVLFAIAGAAVATAPLGGQLRFLAQRGHIADFPLIPVTVEGFLLAAIPLPLAAGALFGAVLARTTGPYQLRWTWTAPGALALCSFSWLIPPVGIAGLVVLGGVRFPWPQYAISAAPGLALLAGAGIAGIHPPHARSAVLLSVVVTCLLAGGGRLHGGDDWRGAVAGVNGLVTGPETPVLVHPGLFESADVDLVEDPEYRSLLLAPLAAYPIEGSPILLPRALTPEVLDYLERSVVPRLRTTDRFLLMTEFPEVPFEAWLNGRLQPLGFDSRPAGTYGVIEVVLFERT